MNNVTQQLQKMKTQPGFVAALDQSGGSTPSALRSYGIKEEAWSNEDEMFAIVHQMRTRIITSPSFTGDRILGAILFEGTMDRDIQGQPSADYLWNVKRVVPFLKVDKGLAAETDGVHLMKPMPELAALLAKAKAKRIFGTKMRLVIKHANAAGTARHGGVLLIAGDDHACKSSTLPHQSEHAFDAAMIPVLYPTGVQEIIDLGLHGFAMSRYSGCYVAFKTISETLDSSATVVIDPASPRIVIPLSLIVGQFCEGSTTQRWSWVWEMP